MQNKDPLISILIPTYNRRDFLKRAIDSVINQDYKNLEIVVTDNASSDDTNELMSSYMSKDKRIIYIRREENIGAILNGYYAYKTLNGKYAMILCDDDYLLSNTFLSKACNVMEENENIVLVKGPTTMYDSSTDTTEIISYRSKSLIKGIEHLLYYTDEGYENIISFFALFRKSKADETGIFEKQIQSTDTWLCLYLFLLGDVYFLSDEIIGCYYQHSSQDLRNIETIKNIDYIPEMMLALENKATALYPEYKDLIHRKIEDRMAGILIWHRAKLCEAIGRKEAFKFFRNSSIRKNKNLYNKVFGNLVFSIPFDFSVLGFRLEKKRLTLFIFGFKIVIKIKK